MLSLVKTSRDAADACRADAVTKRILPKRRGTAHANAFCERLIGTMRRECLDWLIVLNERHLRIVLKEWVAHYNHGRPHASLGPGIPDVAPDTLAQPNGHQIPAGHQAVATPILGGLHHENHWEQSAA